MTGCLSQASSTPTARATSTSMAAGRTSPWWITVSAVWCLSASALICAVVHHETLWSDCCLPFVLWKKKEKMVFMVFLSLPSDAFSARASLYTCKTLETSYFYFFVERWIAVLQFLLLFAPNHCLSHHMCIFEDGNTSTHRWIAFENPQFCLSDSPGVT